MKPDVRGFSTIEESLNALFKPTGEPRWVNPDQSACPGTLTWEGREYPAAAATSKVGTPLMVVFDGPLTGVWSRGNRGWVRKPEWGYYDPRNAGPGQVPTDWLKALEAEPYLRAVQFGGPNGTTVIG